MDPQSESLRLSRIYLDSLTIDERRGLIEYINESPPSINNNIFRHGFHR